MSAAKCLATLTVVLVAAVCATHGQERIKMCGRELIRLAMSSCGNSRLGRSIPDLEPGQNQYSTHWDEGNFMEERRASDAVLAPPESDVFSLAPHWQPVSSHIRRSAGKISDICCERGCSMKELIQFC